MSNKIELLRSWNVRPDGTAHRKGADMNRLFRQPDRGVMGYAALGIFAAAYLFALALVVAPGQILPAAPASASFSD